MKLVILDRDGVINHDSKDYIRCPDDWKPLPNSLTAIAKLKQAGFTVAIATNQSGIGRKYFSHEALAAIHAKMQEELSKYKSAIDYIAYCPHHPDDNCNCRKPLPGLAMEILNHYQAEPKMVYFIGDSKRDLDCAIAASCQPILVRTGNGNRTFDKISKLDEYKDFLVFTDLNAAVSHIVSKLA